MKKLFLFIFLFAFASVYGKWYFVSTVPTGPIITTLNCQDTEINWVCGTGGALYRSTNAGITWVLRNGGLPAVDLFGLSALDSSTCWVGTISGSIYKTTNGGINWILQLAVPGSFSNGIKMFDANRGIYYGDPTSNGAPYQLRYTTNGGTNWILSPGAPLATNEFGVINAWDWTDTSHIWIGSANTVINATTAKIYKTTIGFGGGSWSSATLSGNGNLEGLYYQAVAFVNTLNGMAGSNGSNIRKTTDGGITWQNVTNPSGIDTFAAINMNGLKDGSNTIRVSLNTTTSNFSFRTTNLGTTWISEPLPVQAVTNGLQHMQFLNSALGFAGGNAGAFFKYASIIVNAKLIIEGLYDNVTNQLNLKDTLRAYLHNSITPFNIVDSAIALIDSVSFKGNFVFENAPSGIYYVQLKYRSGLETWSKTGGENFLLGNIYSYDFTTSASQAFGANMSQVDISPVRFGIYSGDVNQNGFIDLIDINLVFNDASNFVTGYVNTDLTGDGFVDLTDLTFTFNNSSNFVSVVRP